MSRIVSWFLALASLALTVVAQTGEHLAVLPELVAVREQEVGLDIKWGLAQGLGLDLTLNTDFAETEEDEVQVNLTRFSLFFPEKREFFLENSGIFEFGTPGGRRGPLFRMFFSRSVGISEEGDPVPLLWGTRLAGKVDRWSLGILQARTDSLTTEEEQIDVTDWTVFRVKRGTVESEEFQITLLGRNLVRNAG